MSGAISFKEKGYWSAAGWVFRIVCDDVCKLIDDDRFGIKSELEDEWVAVIEYVCAEDWSHEKLYFFGEMLRLAYKKHEKLGPRDWNNRDMFPGFMNCYRELIAEVQKAHS